MVRFDGIFSWAKTALATSFLKRLTFDKIFRIFKLLTQAQLFIFMIFCILKILFNELVKFCSGEEHRLIGKSMNPHVFTNENTVVL